MNDEIRVFADGILTAIGQPLLTDVEAVALPSEMDEVKIYQALANIINDRNLPDGGIEKLNAYAVIQGVDFSGKRKVFNNIFIGAPLEN